MRSRRGRPEGGPPRHNAYRADGANGQYILVLPDKDAVIAVTANIPDMQAELNLIWKYLLPAL